MAVHRLPSQFAQRTIARPVTPTCCCCCCCVSSVVAGSIALPLILHQLAPRAGEARSGEATAAGRPGVAETAPDLDTPPPAGRAANRRRAERRQAGIVLATIALPLALGLGWTTLMLQDSRPAWLIVPAVLAGILIGFGGYRLAGVRLPLNLLVPVGVVLVVAGLAVAEFFLWGQGILGMSPAWIGPALCFIVGLPIASTLLIGRFGRKRREGQG